MGNIHEKLFQKKYIGDFEGTITIREKHCANGILIKRINHIVSLITIYFPQSQMYVKYSLK